ncbi:hypothetical protein [Haloferula sargassicola]|uniref:Uncharacterized protein n=1 Tax=Haloferula sargassicola TaxID=490096 RepID=A0ABP9UTB8_9BACT
MSHNLAREKREDYLAQFGESYDPARYSSPETTPVGRRQLVASIKVCDAHARQTDIHYELQKLPKAGDAVILDSKHEHLPKEHEEQAEIIKLWSPHTKAAS